MNLNKSNTCIVKNLIFNANKKGSRKAPFFYYFFNYYKFGHPSAMALAFTISPMALPDFRPTSQSKR